MKKSIDMSNILRTMLNFQHIEMDNDGIHVQENMLELITDIINNNKLYSKEVIEYFNTKSILSKFNKPNSTNKYSVDIFGLPIRHLMINNLKSPFGWRMIDEKIINIHVSNTNIETSNPDTYVITKNYVINKFKNKLKNLNKYFIK